MKENKGSVVLCCYRPKPGKQAELLEVLRDHVQTLRMLGFAAGHARTLMTAADGTVIEIFQWDSEDASRKAHDHPEVRKIWKRIEDLAACVPIGTVAEAAKPFSPFQSVVSERRDRVIHFEIEADEPERLKKFYGDAFGWQYYPFGDPASPYWLTDTGSEPMPGIDGGILKKNMPEGGVINVIRVDSVDASLEKIRDAGGTVCVPKRAVPGVGYLAYCLDPEENVFGLMQPDMDAK